MVDYPGSFIYGNHSCNQCDGKKICPLVVNSDEPNNCEYYWPEKWAELWNKHFPDWYLILMKEPSHE